ncbi:MAG TPA: hypothetical protein VEI97_20185 [bacterium]|nr:hypothetical protein [bacterium]
MRPLFQVTGLFLLAAATQIFGLACNESVVPDRALQGELREKTGKWAGSLMPADLAGIRELSLPQVGIQSLEGLQHCASLEELTLTVPELQNTCGVPVGVNNQINNLAVLAQLRALRTLKIEGNPIQDLSPLAGLTRLEILAVDRCRVQDITPLQALTALRYLGLSRNHILDISPLVENGGLGPGDAIDLSANPLDPKAEAVGKLRARGVALVVENCSTAPPQNV